MPVLISLGNNQKKIEWMDMERFKELDEMIRFVPYAFGDHFILSYIAACKFMPEVLEELRDMRGGRKVKRAKKLGCDMSKLQKLADYIVYSTAAEELDCQIRPLHGRWEGCGVSATDGSVATATKEILKERMKQKYRQPSKPAYEIPSAVTKVSFEGITEDMDIDKIAYDTRAIISDSIAKLPEPGKFYHEHRDLLKKIKNGKAEIGDILAAIESISNASDYDLKLKALEASLKGDRFGHIAALSELDPDNIYLKWWERNPDTDEYAGIGTNCCWKSMAMSNLLNSPSSLLEVWYGGYRDCGVFVLDANYNGKPVLAIDSIESGMRFFSRVADRFKLSHAESIVKPVTAIMQGVRHKVVQSGYDMAILPDSNMPEIKACMEEYCKTVGAQRILSLNHELENTDISFKDMPYLVKKTC